MIHHIHAYQEHFYVVNIWFCHPTESPTDFEVPATFEIGVVSTSLEPLVVLGSPHDMASVYIEDNESKHS